VRNTGEKRRKTRAVSTELLKEVALWGKAAFLHNSINSREVTKELRRG